MTGAVERLFILHVVASISLLIYDRIPLISYTKIVLFKFKNRKRLMKDPTLFGFDVYFKYIKLEFFHLRPKKNYIRCYTTIKLKPLT